MASYEIFFKESVRKDLRKIPALDIARILELVNNLAQNPRPRGCEKLSAFDRYRIRHGRYRIVYSIQDKQLTIWVIKIAR